MPTPVAHAHTATCIGGNELNELTCGHLGGPSLLAACTFSVPVRVPRTGARTGSTIHHVRVFTDTAQDALALARAAGHQVAGPAHKLLRQPKDPYV